MILAVDVAYSDGCAAVAGIAFADWRDAAPAMELVSCIGVPAAYQPGQFYQRELPCILKLIGEHNLRFECIVVDGYVYLDGSGTAGLGKRLYDALGSGIPVIGVAKNRFKAIGPECEVYRGRSSRPLYVTAAGMELDKAKELIRTMHGNYRQPTLLKRTDHVSRAFRC